LVALSCLLALVGGLLSGIGSATADRLIALASGPIVLAAAAGLVTLTLRGHRWALQALVLLAAADLALYGLGGSVVWQKNATREEALRQVAAEDPLPPAGKGRLVRGEMDSVYVLDGRRLLDGYAALMPMRRLNYLSLPALRVAEVEYVHAAFQEAARIEHAEPVGGGWYRLPAPLPRARLVTGSQVSAQPDVDLEHLDIEHVALATRELGLTGEVAGMAEIVEDHPGLIRVKTNTAGRQLLVISECFHPGWQAQVDGEPVPVEQINGDFMGCVVEAGQHEVLLEFLPAHVALGQAISLAGLAGAIMLAAWPLLMRPRS
jgi:hypothetical protein